MKVTEQVGVYNGGDSHLDGSAAPVAPGESQQQQLYLSGYSQAPTAMSSIPSSTAADMNGFPLHAASYMTNGATNGAAPLSEMAPFHNSAYSVHGSPSLSPVDPVQLRAQLKRQLEYYFSRENLNHDAYLHSQMDGDQYVYIHVVANFNLVKKLTTDLDLIVDILKESTNVQVDATNTKVRPLIKRCVLILREIPEGTTQKEVEDIFIAGGFANFVSCEPATDGWWYIRFETDEQAQQAHFYINNTLHEYKGQKIMARIKAQPTQGAPTPARSDQRADTAANSVGPPSAGGPRASLPTQPGGIRYPVPLQHLPLQTPPYYAVAPSPFSYMATPYIMPHLISPPWSAAVFSDPNLNFDMNGGIYLTSNPNGRINGPMHHGGRSGHSERRHHSRSHSGASDYSDTSTLNSSGTGSNLSSAAAKGSVTAAAHSGGAYHNQGRGNYSRMNNDSNKVSSRGKHYSGGMSSGEQPGHYPPVEIPPRHRDASGSGYRIHKRNISGHNNGTGHPNSQPPPPRDAHSNPPLHRRNSGSMRGPAHNVTNSANSMAAVSQPSNGYMEPNSIHHPMQHRPVSSGGGGPPTDFGRRQEKAKEQATSSKQSSGLDGGESKTKSNYGAQKKASPDREIDITVIPSETFELDSSAFPALPGAILSSTTSAAAPATPVILDNSASTQTITTTATTSSTGIEPVAQRSGGQTDASGSPSGSKSPAEPATSVDKQPNAVVKAKTPDAPKSIADIVKSNPKPMTSNLASNHPSNKENISHGQAAIHKGQTTKANTANQNSSNDKTRPAHLPNGLHTGREGHHHHQQTSAAHRQSKLAGHKTGVSSNPTPSQSAPQSAVSPHHPKSKSLSPDSSTPHGPTSPESASSESTHKANSTANSPTDAKLSYAAMAQKTAAAQSVKGAASQEATAGSGQLLAAGASSGDSNNNSGENAPAPAKNTDKNLYQTKYQSGAGPSQQSRSKQPAVNQTQKAARSKGSSRSATIAAPPAATVSSPPTPSMATS